MHLIFQGTPVLDYRRGIQLILWTYSIHYSLRCTVVACLRPGILSRVSN